MSYFRAFFTVLQMASSLRFVDLSEDDIIRFCDEQENENATKRRYAISLFTRNSLQFTSNFWAIVVLTNVLTIAYNVLLIKGF